MELTFIKSDEDRKNFLNQNWNRKHLHITNGVNNLFKISDVDLVELLLDQDVESRAVTYKNERKLSYGSFNLDQIKDIQKESHTFIIHNLHLIFEELNELEKQFSFLPNWLFDDIMCTYSNQDSSLGAHFDPYNVMIIQIEGQRKWELQYDFEKELKENEEIKVIKNFNAQHEFILNPGDVLFIPKGCAHRGTSLKDSLSYSIGFKAIEMNKIVQSYFAQQILNNEDSEIIDINQSNHELSQSIIDSFKAHLNELTRDEKKLKEYLLKQITPNKIYEPEIIDEEIDFNQTYFKIADFKWSYVKHNEKTLISINSSPLEISNEHFDYIYKILNNPTLELFTPFITENKEVIEFLNKILSYGFIEKSDT